MEGENPEKASTLSTFKLNSMRLHERQASGSGDFAKGIGVGNSGVTTCLQSE